MNAKLELIETLQGIPWFLELSAGQVERLAEIGSLVSFKTGDTLFCEGDRVDNVYVVLSGEVEITMTVPAHGPVRIYYAEPLDVIGWSPLTPMVRQRITSAYAHQNTQLLLLPGDALSELCEEDRNLGYVVMKRIANVAASNVLMVKLQMIEQILSESHSSAL